jgi:hypothetical protein
MGTFSETYERHPERIRPLDEMKRCAIVDVLDQCCGNDLIAVRLLGMGEQRFIGWRGSTTIGRQRQTEEARCA